MIHCRICNFYFDDSKFKENEFIICPMCKRITGFKYKEIGIGG